MSEADGAASPNSAESSKQFQRRPSLNPDTNIIEDSQKLDQGERRLSVSAMRSRSDLEMWLMCEVPDLMGVSEDETDQLPEVLQDPSEFCDGVLFDKETLDTAAIQQKVDEGFKAHAGEKPGWAKFCEELVRRIAEARGTIVEARKNSKTVSASG